MRPTHHYAELSTGIRAHYLQWGGDKPVIVLAHATGFLAEIWTPIAERLAGRFTVIAPDARGHGESDKPEPNEEDYHWRNQIDDHKAFLDALGIRGASFAGHSAGASAGMYVAAHDAGYYDRLVAIEPIIMPGGVKPDGARRAQMAESARRRRNVFADVQEMFDQYRARPLFDRWPDEMLRLYCESGTFRREDGQVQLKCPPEVEGAIFANSGSLDIWSVLPDLRAPTLVVRGAETEPFLSMTAEAVAARLPDGRLETVAGARHLVPMEEPDVVAGLILEFSD